MDNFSKYLSLLKEFIAFKSISTDTAYKNDIALTINWLKNLFKKNQFAVKILTGKTCNPVVFAEYSMSDSLETVLIYGHYDVQPADLNGWKADPFTLLTDSKKLYGRGVVDNKGQILIHICTILKLIKEGKLKYNVKFLIEGNEETSNPDMSGIMAKNRKLLKCDFVLISDGELTNDRPTIELSLRGGFNSTLEIKTGKTNLHSGLFGGAIPNAAEEMSQFLAKLYDEDGMVTFKDFYTGVDKTTREQLENNRRLEKEAGSFTKLAGVKSLKMPKDMDFFTRTGLTPTIQISGISSGYTDEGYANIVPAVSTAKLNFRLAPSQDPRKIANIFEKYVKKNIPSYCDVKLEFQGYHSPVKIDIQNIFAKRTEKILKDVYGGRVNRKNVGGAIPFVADVKTLLKADPILVPLVNEDCNMHGTNENFDIKLAKKALEFSEKFFSTQ